MRNIFYTLLVSFAGLFMPKIGTCQVIKASAHFGTTPTSLIVVLRPDFNFSDRLNEVGFAIQVPKFVNGTPVPLPTITVLNNYLPTTFTTWPQINESASDANYYNFKFGSVAFASAPILNIPAGTELQVFEIQITVPAEAIPLTKLAHLASGGPGTQYGVAIIDGSLKDRTNYAQMFYGTGLTPAAPAADETIGYETYQSVLPSSSPLPVKFTGFNVVKKNNDGLITWQVESETSVTDRYEIERSLNGVDFQKVYTVAPKKNGNSTNNYELTDINLSTVRSTGIIYYRIKQTDKDGKFVYTGIKSLRLNAKSMAVGIYPNPIRNFANLSIDLEQDSNATITINDASGKQVQNIQMPLFKGPNIKKINMGALASGSYILKVQTATETETISVVKTN